MSKKIYFGFAISDSMFNGELILQRTEVNANYAKSQLEEAEENGNLVIACNPSHGSTLNVLKSKHDITIDIPATPPSISLNKGDRLILMSVRGLPRLTDRHEYNDEEISKATFTWAIWNVLNINANDFIGHINGEF